MAALRFPRNDCRSRRKTGAVCTQGIPEPQRRQEEPGRSRKHPEL